MGYQKHVLIFLISLVLTQIISGSEALESLVIASHCTSECGGITIPYPFGIEDGCYYKDKDDHSLNPSMRITCNHTFSPPQPILGNNIQILNISVKEAEIHLNSNISYKCDESDNSSYYYSYSWINLRSFTISSSKNKFVATGCDTYAWFKGKRYGKNYSTGCMTTCNELNDVANDGRCNGVGCCQASIPDGVTNLKTEAYSYNHHTGVEFNPCSVACPVANNAFKFSKQNLTRNLSYYLNEPPKFPVVYNWGIGTKNCSEAEKEESCLCKSNTDCINLTHEQQGLDGYRCDCKKGYSGNPYLPQGCQDINECEAASDECEKPEYCRNDVGGYHCECPNGYHGIGTNTDHCISNTKTKPWLMPVILTAGTGGVIIILLIIAFIAYWRHGERKITALREKNFRDNGGEILHQKVSGMDVLKIFTIQELENATDNYNEANIIGKGGFGVVYKGVISGNQPVAIKRSLKVDPNQVEQFINEVLILSQINNRNVVKLLGCCLETEVPLLVYEFINNGTLYAHLHDEDKVPHLTWNLRLRIASEIADVLSYLHTTISTPIIHRDMKSMNVLLDESYTAKVADFGASKLVPLDQGQLATMVVGTQGYLDPEYMLSFELTEKSDVYSFGVVLVELLTKKKALSNQESELERCLALHFISKMKQDRLFDIVDKNISNGLKEIEQIKKVANLAKLCLRLKREKRPTMKEVAMELEGIKRMGSNVKHSIGQSFDELENFGGHLVEFPTVDDGNNGGRDSDIHSLLKNGR
ncbi:wall-associated receptor kinase 5-like [Silene latifolia]|uniref:wall-associated receptor kinase 5-like n=1 Tax=Silene latifolia TaxID=37657 RepID=UPI003D7849A1